MMPYPFPADIEINALLHFKEAQLRIEVLLMVVSLFIHGRIAANPL